MSSDVALGPTGRSAEFVRGAVLKVHMHNFMTYGDCTVEPGARLNLVLGPNGVLPMDPPPPPPPPPHSQRFQLSQSVRPMEP